jgi:uncharacterized membrane protein
MINLPILEIPAIELPIPIPELFHPAVVHFVIVLPVIILLIELFNTLFKKRALSITSLFLMILLTAISLGAYLTGSVDSKNVHDLLSVDGQKVLQEHKQIGIYLVYGSIIVIIFKFISMMMKASIIRLLFVLVLIGFTIVTLYQGKEGGELVYKYASNVKPVVELNAKVSNLEKESQKSKIEYQATIKTLEEKIAKLEELAKNTTTLKDENEKLNTQIDTLKTELQDSKKSLEAQITKAKKTIDNLEAQITTLKDKASKIAKATKEVVEEKIETVVETVAPTTTETNSSTK